MKKNKPNIIAITIMTAFIIILLTMTIYLVYNYINDKENNLSNTANEGYTKEELLTMLNGYWENQDVDNIHIVARFNLENNYFINAQYATDAGRSGSIESISKVSETVYTLTIYSPACTDDSCLAIKDEERYEVKIDLKDYDSDIIYLTMPNQEEQTYKFISATDDEVFSYFFE